MLIPTFRVFSSAGGCFPRPALAQLGSVHRGSSEEVSEILQEVGNPRYVVFCEHRPVAIANFWKCCKCGGTLYPVCTALLQMLTFGNVANRGRVEAFRSQTWDDLGLDATACPPTSPPPARPGLPLQRQAGGHADVSRFGYLKKKKLAPSGFAMRGRLPSLLPAYTGSTSCRGTFLRAHGAILWMAARVWLREAGCRMMGNAWMSEIFFAGHFPEKGAFFQRKPDLKGREASWSDTYDC